MQAKDLCKGIFEGSLKALAKERARERERVSECVASVSNGEDVSNCPFACAHCRSTKVHDICEEIM